MTAILDKRSLLRREFPFVKNDVVVDITLFYSPRKKKFLRPFIISSRQKKIVYKVWEGEYIKIRYTKYSKGMIQNTMYLTLEQLTRNNDTKTKEAKITFNEIDVLNKLALQQLILIVKALDTSSDHKHKVSKFIFYHIFNDDEDIALREFVNEERKIVIKNPFIL